MLTTEGQNNPTSGLKKRVRQFYRCFAGRLSTATSDSGEIGPERCQKEKKIEKIGIFLEKGKYIYNKTPSLSLYKSAQIFVNACAKLNFIY
jgi:hypothetical protein